MGIKIYADGSEPDEMVAVRETVSGFTTNPTLMRKAGVVDYEAFAREMLRRITDVPISFEVIADDLGQMETQAKKLASFGENVYVKIPVTNTTGDTTAGLIHRLLGDGIKVNVTAVFSYEQIAKVCQYLSSSTPAILSIFAGRIADTGRDPKPYVRRAIEIAPENTEVLWASCREVYNVYEAEALGCHIITVPNNLIKKLSLRHKRLDQYSLETVQMFYDDAQSSGLTL